MENATYIYFFRKKKNEKLPGMCKYLLEALVKIVKLCGTEECNVWKKGVQMFTSVLWQLTEPRYKRRDDVILARAPVAMRSLCRAWNRRLNKWEGGREKERDGGEKKARDGEGYEITCVGVKEEEDFAQHIL